MDESPLPVAEIRAVLAKLERIANEAARQRRGHVEEIHERGMVHHVHIPARGEPALAVCEPADLRTLTETVHRLLAIEVKYERLRADLLAVANGDLPAP